jgi:RNA recognition motif-containing protein
VKTKLYVRNLAAFTQDADLRAAFEPHARVVAAEVITNRLTGQSRGFGYVELGTAEEAELAAQALDGSMLGGRTIQVSVARARAISGRKAGYRRNRS